MVWLDPLNLPAHRPSFDKNLWPPGSELRSKFGVQFLWWPRKLGGFHLPKEDLEPYRFVGDGQVDNILQLLDNENDALGPSGDFLELVQVAREVHSSQRSPAQEAMVEFIQKYSELPVWVDKEQLRRGQNVFLAYTPVASLALYYRSLVAGFSIPKIAAVIRATAYLAPPSRPDQALQRLLDTGELITACMGIGLDSLLPDGLGWKTAIYVRVLHAKIRYALLGRKGTRQWDVAKYGIPINQEDLSATLLAFSVNVLDGIDIIAGTTVREQERLDYLALWRYIGWLMGVEVEGDIRSAKYLSVEDLPPLDPCGPGRSERPDPCRHSAAILDSILDHLLDPDETSVEISHHLLKITDRKPPSSKLSEIPDEFYKNDLFYYRALQCRRLIGDPLADSLHLPFHPNRWKRMKCMIKSAFVLSIFRCYTLASMWIPLARRKVIQWHTSAFLRFHEEWIKTHQTKMGRALARNERATCLVEEETPNSTSYQSNGTNESYQSLCPFAMVAPPQIPDDP